MKKVLLLASDITDNKKKLVQLLSDKLKKEVEINLDLLGNLAFSIESGNLNAFISGVNIKEFSYVYIRKKTNYTNLARTLTIFLKANKIPFADEALYSASLMGNKLTSFSRLAKAKTPVSTSFYSHNYANEFSLSSIKKLNFPVITKSMTAQRMEGVYVIKNENELKTFITKNNKKQFLFQKFIDIKEEYRIFVLDGVAASAHTKTRRNYSVDKIEYLDENEWHKFVDLDTLPKKLIKIAQKAAQELQINIAGVDVCKDKEGNIFCIEVNRGPGLDYNEDNPEEVTALANFLHQKTR